MDLKNDNFAGFLLRQCQGRKKQEELNGNKLASLSYRNDCTKIYNGCFTRSKEIEIKLENIFRESALPRFEQIVEHLRGLQGFFDEIECDPIQSAPKFAQADSSFSQNADDDLDNISFVSSVKRQFSNDIDTIKNFDFLLKELISLVSQFINLIDKSANQHIIEKAAVYLLWLYFDSSNFNNLSNQFINSNTSKNANNFNSNYANLEYVFCLDNLNNQILERICYVAKSILQLMDPNFLNTVFYYSSMVRKAACDVEMQEKSDIDWFALLEQELVKNDIAIDHVDPFEYDSYNYFPMNGEDLRLTNESSTDFEKFHFDYVNSEFILQNLLNNGNIVISKEFANLNMSNDFQNQNKNIEKQPIQQFDSNLESSHQSTEDSITLLFSELSNFISKYNSCHEDPYYLNHEELFNTILNWIIENKPDENLVIELTNLLGEDNASLISKLITFYKPNILKSNATFPQNSTDDDIKADHRTVNNPNGASTMQRAENMWKIVCQAKGEGANIRPSIIVHTEKEKVLKKEMRKIEKKYTKELNKVQKNVNNDVQNGTEKLTLQDLEKMRENNLKASLRTAFEPQIENLRPAQVVEQYPYVFDLYQKIKTSASYIADTKLLLPDGFEKREFRTHDEFEIPIMSSSEETKEFLKAFQQIEIKDTDDFCRIGFDGFTNLNLIQSTVFQTAYLTDNQNMLICAPTGAGKTNIAMLSILNILRSYSVDGTPNCIKHEQFKIVYIAPMKALCAEMTATFSRRLEPFGVKVRELTGDMQLTSKEIMETQMLVVTPEKWDIVTRKSVGDVQLLDLVRLIIIDEIHLLQSDRGHVLETLVARTIRYVEQAQKCIRLVGLSATLPNYIDVAQFLHVDLYKGLFVFDERFRPVPLMKTFIGCKANNKNQLNADMDEITYEKAKEILLKEHQVMVFVHSRNATNQVATYLLDRVAIERDERVRVIFQKDTSRLFGSDKLINRARYRNLNKFLENGIGMHHAGMPRPERNVVEKLFSAGVIKVLVCTSTLAWGVNLPAHAVIIRGTEFYDPSHGHMVDIDMLDVMQIFGRAGRPQFDKDGEATIITTHGKLAHYLSMLTNQLPIESKFLKRLTDNLNAEIVLGTVSNISEAVDWLKYTYAYIRMHKNPLEYGLTTYASLDQSIIIDHLFSLVRSSAEKLDRAEMVRYNPDTEGLLDATHLGRIASHFYIQHETIVNFNETLFESMDTGHILDMLSKAHEFEQLRVRH